MDIRTLNARPERFRFLVLSVVAAALLLFCRDAGASNLVPVDVTVGKSIVLTTQHLKTVSITDKTIADYIVISQNEMQIIGKKAGTTSMITWDASGMKTFFDINVNVDTTLLEERIAEAAPGDPVKVKAMKNTIIVTGSVLNSERYFRVNELLKAVGRNVTDNKTVTYLTGGQSVVTNDSGSDTDTGIKFTNLLEISDQPQVMLQITVASIDRTALKDLGVNWSEIAKGVALFSTVGSALPITQITNLAPVGAVPLTGNQQFGNNANFGVIDTKNGTAYMIRALANKGLAKVLAEPNLIVKSGEEGKFVAGGEFPIPIVSGASAGSAATVTVEYKEFGVVLNFKPVVKESGIIQLKIDPAEVSALDPASSVTLSGFVIPGLKKDTVSTSVDLREGESFLMAGLIRDDWAKNMQKFPFLGDVPIIGAFFREQHMDKTERELVFFVSPKIVRPSTPVAKSDLPGANEPSAAQDEDMKWVPGMPNSRTLDPEKVGK